MTETESPSAAEPFERLSREPLYQKVHQALLERLKNGVWQPGTKLPAETDLAREFGVAVGTVRKAVTWLVTDGVLERRPGRGTFAATIRNSGYRNNFQPFTSVDGKARFTERELIDFERIAATEEVAAALGLKAGDPDERRQRRKVYVVFDSFDLFDA